MVNTTLSSVNCQWNAIRLYIRILAWMSVHAKILKPITDYSLWGSLFSLAFVYISSSLAFGWDGTVSANHIRSWTRYCSSHSQWKSFFSEVSLSTTWASHQQHLLVSLPLCYFVWLMAACLSELMLRCPCVFCSWLTTAWHWCLESVWTPKLPLGSPKNCPPNG